jgi:hypothetical protein
MTIKTLFLIIIGLSCKQKHPLSEVEGVFLERREKSERRRCTVIIARKSEYVLGKKLFGKE